MTTPKDEVLATLAETVNVAQFVSFAAAPSLPLRFARLRGLSFGAQFPTAREAVAALLERSAHGTVNIRTFRPSPPDSDSKAQPFHYGLHHVDEILAVLHARAAEGFHTIVNETVPVDDGGVSGVALGGALEFAPDDTPRCVEKPGTTAMPVEKAKQLLRIVYGFAPDVDASSDRRVEWSIHPRRVGLHHTHTLIWEVEHVAPVTVPTQLAWPNHFSRLLGDKVFGLLIADLSNVPVPHTIAVPRRLAPFSFGRETGSAERWIRTAPAEPVPGYYPTFLGWHDPYRLLAQHDPGGSVAAVLAQASVDALFSGAALSAENEYVVVEGVHGRGDEFMVGRIHPERLPDSAVARVRVLVEGLVGRFGPLRAEWAFDGEQIWVLQLQQSKAPSSGTAIVAGDAVHWHRFDPANGLEELRALIGKVSHTEDGILICGDVGVTSHFGDLLRRAGVPSRIERGGAEGN